MTGRAQKIPAVRADAVPTSAREEGASGTPGGAAGTRRTKIGGLAYSVRIAVVGNPNSGKTTIFNMLTGSRQHVGNYSGVTVEKKEGVLLHEGREVIFLDLPGAYSLSAYSPEERIAGAVLRAGTEQAVLYVADAGLLERSLVLAVQIREMGMPMVLACNMMDELRAHGKDIDFAALSGALNVTALPTVGVRGQGMEELLDAVERAGREDPPPPLHVSYGPVLDPLLDELVVLLEQRFPTALPGTALCRRAGWPLCCWRRTTAHGTRCAWTGRKRKKPQRPSAARPRQPCGQEAWRWRSLLPDSVFATAVKLRAVASRVGGRTMRA